MSEKDTETGASTALVKLDGTLIQTDGTTKKSRLFSFLQLQPDDYSEISFTPEEATKIRSHLSHLSTGASAAVPLTCGGAAVCPFAERCPFVRIDKDRRQLDPKAKLGTPVGRACLVEVQLLNEWTRLYLEEYDVEEDNFTEFQMVRDLAETELLLWRLNNNLAKPKNAELIQDVVVGVDKQGNTLTRQEMNAFMSAKESLQNRKNKLFKLMVGDRQEKYKREAALKMRGGDDPSSTAANLRSQMDALLRQATQMNLKVKQIEGKVIEVDADSPVKGTLPEAEKPLSPEALIGDDEE